MDILSAVFFGLVIPIWAYGSYRYRERQHRERMFCLRRGRIPPPARGHPGWRLVFIVVLALLAALGLQKWVLVWLHWARAPVAVVAMFVAGFCGLLVLLFVIAVRDAVTMLRSRKTTTR